MFVNLIIYSLVVLSGGFECNGQELHSFRQQVISDVTYLQIFANAEWFNIFEIFVDYRETYYACRDLSNTAMVEYARTEDVDNGHNFFEFECDSLPADISACDKLDTTTNDRDRAILLTCLNFTEYNEGDLLQLDDGRIIQLVEFSNGRFHIGAYHWNT